MFILIDKDISGSRIRVQDQQFIWQKFLPIRPGRQEQTYQHLGFWRHEKIPVKTSPTRTKS